MTLSTTDTQRNNTPHYAKCRCAECRSLLIVMLSVVMLSVVMLNVIMLNVFMLSVVMLSIGNSGIRLGINYSVSNETKRDE